MKTTSVLFVCLGNICRSPSAEAVFKAFIAEKGEEEEFFIDSAGTSSWHEGEPADHRMQQHAIKRGYDLTSLSRPFIAHKDFDRFDYIVAMDDRNYDDMKEQSRSLEDQDKLFKMTDFCTRFNYDHVPDPYYGGSDGFELVLDLLEDASEGLYKKIKS